MTKIVDYFSEIADPREQYEGKNRLSDYISVENKINSLNFSNLIRRNWGIENLLQWHLKLLLKEINVRL